MNITIITEVLPWPLNSGGAQAQFNMINKLRKLHHFTLIFLENGQNKISYMKELQEKWPEVKIVCFPMWRQLLYPKFFIEKIKRAFGVFFTPESVRFKVERIMKPYGVGYSRDFIKFVNKIIKDEHTDVIQVEFYNCLHIGNYLPADIKKIFIHHELRYVRILRLTSPFELTKKEIQFREKLKALELQDLEKYDTVVTLTEEDKNYLLEEGLKTPIQVSPAGVQTESCPYKEWNGKMSFVGGFNHNPNQEGIDWYKEKVLPLLDIDAPVLDIVGKEWPESYASEYIDLKGFVENLQTAIHGTIMIVPILSGSGMRMKIIEAMAMSMPVVTTTIGVEGIGLVNGESCLIADKPEDFADSIKRLVSDYSLRKRMAEKANEEFRKHYSIETLSNIRNKLYEI